MFEEVESYERFMGRWSRKLAPQLVGFAGVRPGDRALDVGTGTGALAAALLESAAEVTAVDPSAGYILHAQGRHAGIRFEVGDGQALRFDDGRFDRCLSMLALNFVPDPRRAAREMLRVTRPGGVAAAAVWDYADGMRMLRAFWDAAAALDPDAERRDEGRMPFCREGQLVDLWTELGFESVEGAELVVRQEFASFEDYWAPFLLGTGPAGAYAAQLPPERQGALRERLRAGLWGDGPDRGLTLEARAWGVRGAVPARGDGR